LTPRELEVVRATAAVLIGYDGADLVRAVEIGELMELEP